MSAAPRSTARTLEVARTARYHELGQGGAETRASCFVLHGYGQLAGPFLEAFAAHANATRLLIAPEALSRFYLRRGTGEVGASWMTREERAHEIQDMVRYLDLVWSHVRAQHALAGMVELSALGFSQGGAAAARWAVLGDAPLARVTLWGCPLPLDLELASAAHVARARALRWTFVLGDGDTSIDRAGWEQGIERLRALAIEPELLRFDGGHALEPALLARVLARSTAGQ